MKEEKEVNGGGAENGNPKEMKQEAQEKIVEVLVEKLDQYFSFVISDLIPEESVDTKKLRDKKLKDDLIAINDALNMSSYLQILTFIKHYMDQIKLVENIQSNVELSHSTLLCQKIEFIKSILVGKLDSLDENSEEFTEDEISNLKLLEVELSEQLSRLTLLVTAYSNEEAMRKAKKAEEDRKAKEAQEAQEAQKAEKDQKVLLGYKDNIAKEFLKNLNDQKQALETEVKELGADPQTGKWGQTFFLLPHQKYEVNTKRIKVKVLDALEKAFKEVAENKTDFSQVWEAACQESKITADDLKRAMRSMKTSRTKDILLAVEEFFKVKLSDGVYQAPSKSPGKTGK